MTKPYYSLDLIHTLHPVDVLRVVFYVWRFERLPDHWYSFSPVLIGPRKSKPAILSPVIGTEIYVALNQELLFAIKWSVDMNAPAFLSSSQCSRLLQPHPLRSTLQDKAGRHAFLVVISRFFDPCFTREAPNVLGSRLKNAVMKGVRSRGRSLGTWCLISWFQKTCSVVLIRGWVSIQRLVQGSLIHLWLPPAVRLFRRVALGIYALQSICFICWCGSSYWVYVETHLHLVLLLTQFVYCKWRQHLIEREGISL